MKTFHASVQSSLVIDPRILGVLVWSNDEAAYFPAVGEQDGVDAINTAIASCRTSGSSLADLVAYYLETGGGGYQSFSQPEVVEADTLGGAAEMMAKRAGIALVLPSAPAPPPRPARDAERRVARPRHDPSRRIRLARAVVEVLAPDVAVAWFVWTKPPDNHYVSFYPTAMLPPRGSPRWNDEDGGRRIFNAAVDPMADPPRPLTFGEYDATLSFPFWAANRDVPPIWPPPKTIQGLPRLPRGLTSRLTGGERVAVRAILATLDVRWLRENGQPDPATTAAVLGWIDAVVEALAASPGSDVRMSFERSGSLEALVSAEVVSATSTKMLTWRGPV